MLVYLAEQTKKQESHQLNELVAGVLDQLHNTPAVQQAYHAYAIRRLGMAEDSTIGGGPDEGRDIPESDPRYEVYYELTQIWWMKFLARLTARQAG